jgi:hypothetical protein
MKTLSASVNQHPPVQQSAVLFTGEGEGGISHPVVECALTTVNLFGADPFLRSIFSYGSLNFDLTYIALYYLRNSDRILVLHQLFNKWRLL